MNTSVYLYTLLFANDESLISRLFASLLTDLLLSTLLYLVCTFEQKDEVVIKLEWSLTNWYVRICNGEFGMVADRQKIK